MIEPISHKEFDFAVRETAIVRKGLFGGAIIRIHLLSTKSTNYNRKLQKLFPHLFSKGIYFWAPFKAKVDEDNYGAYGPASRAPFANLWYQIKTDHALYLLSTKKFENLSLKDGKDYKSSNLRLSFLSSDWIKVTSKPMIRLLNKILF